MRRGNGANQTLDSVVSSRPEDRLRPGSISAVDTGLRRCDSAAIGLSERIGEAMPVYVIADVKVTNPAGYESYRPLAGASIARFGGRFVVRGGKAELLEGMLEPERVVVIEFPDLDTARRWYYSDEYQSALKIRQANSTGRVILVEGAG
jgi:uncharacterized protein (DUF1330 family)